MATNGIKSGQPGHKNDGSFYAGKHLQCTAMSKRSGVQCKGIAVVGSRTQKCRMHGGTAPTGADDPSFKSGRYSRQLPSDIDRLYREALSNPDLLEMADHIALLEARIKSILEAAAAGDPVPRWSEMAELFAEVETDILSGDIERVMPGLERMHKLLEAGQKWDRTWDNVTDTMEQLRKMADTEVKRKKELNQMVPIERVVVLMAAVAHAVKRHVKDPDQVAAVYRELSALKDSDRVPGNPKIERNGPEIIDIPAPRRRRMKAAMEVVVAAPSN